MKALTVEYWSKLFRKFWKRLLGANKPKKGDTKTNNFYFNLFVLGVVLFHVSGSLITRLEANQDFSGYYTGMLTLNIIGIYFASQGLMKLYRRAKKTVAKLPEFKSKVTERELIKTVRKARVHKLKGNR